MEMSISYRICAEISPDGNIWTDKTGYRSDIEETVPTKRSGDHRGTGMPRSHSYVDTVGRNKKAIRAYIANQLQEDQIADQVSLKEFTDPFTGSKQK